MSAKAVRADLQIIEELQRKRFSGISVSDLEMQRYLNKAKAIRPDIIEGAFAVAYVYSYWRKFSLAERHTDALVKQWPMTSEALHRAVVCYCMACCYTKGLETAQKLVDIDPGNPESARLLSYASLLSGAISEHERAKDIMKRIGIAEAEIPSTENEEEREFLIKNNISEDDVSKYFQLHLDVAKPFLDSNQRALLGTDVHLDTDHENGDQEFWINLVVNTDGETASKIDWEFSKNSFPGFPSEFKEKVWVGVTLADDAQLDSRKFHL